jgi:hypothetical protein
MGNINAARSAPAGLLDVRLPSRSRIHAPIRAGLASGPLSQPEASPRQAFTGVSTV